MARQTTVTIDPQVYEMACRGAALDGIDVAKYLECFVMRDAEHIRTREFIEEALRGDEHGNKARFAS